MNKRRFFLFLLVLLLVLGTAWYYLFGFIGYDEAKQSLKDTAQNVALGAASPEDVAALAVKAIEMKQGEHGIELWRLKADWGNARQEGGLLELEKPKFTYYMPPDNQELKVVSEKGELNQATKIIKFISSVVVSQGNNTLKAPLMIYNGTAKTLYFPDGAQFVGRNMWGRADTALWRLNDRVIDASGGVDMTWERSLDPVKPQPAVVPDMAASAPPTAAP